MFCKEVKKIWLKCVYCLTEMKSQEERHQMCRCWRQNWEVCVLSSARKQGQGIPLLTVPPFPNHNHFLDSLLSVCGSFFSFPNSQPPFKLKVSPTRLSCSWHPELNPEQLLFPSPTDQALPVLWSSLWDRKTGKTSLGCKENQGSNTRYYFSHLLFYSETASLEKTWVLY